MSDNNQKHKHHYVPEAYLRGFYGSDNLLWVFDRKWRTYKQKAAAGIAYTEHYYTVDTVDEQNSSEVEDMFGGVESVSLPLLIKLANGESITPVERGDIATYFALQILRVPDTEKFFTESFEKTTEAHLKAWLTSVANNEQAFQALRQDMSKNGLNARLTQADIQKVLESDGIKLDIDVPRSYIIKQSLEMANEIARGLNRLNWCILTAPKDKAFITSDNPFVTYGDGILGKNSWKLFPLDKRHLVLIGHTEDASLNYVAATDKAVRNANNDIAHRSDRYLISHSQDLLESIVRRTKANGFMTKSRASVERIQLGDDESLIVLKNDRRL